MQIGYWVLCRLLLWHREVNTYMEPRLAPAHHGLLFPHLILCFPLCPGVRNPVGDRRLTGLDNILAPVPR